MPSGYWTETITCQGGCGSGELTRAQAHTCDGCNESFCPSCFYGHIEQCHWRTCEGCDDSITVQNYEDGDCYYCDECGDYRCGDCGTCPDCLQGASGYQGYDPERVHSWSYRPNAFRPKGNYPAEVLMGVELEVGRNRGDIVPTVAEIDPEEDHLYLKTDGSITGLEIVTHPMTLAWSRAWRGGTAGTAGTAGLPGGFSAMLTGLRDAGCYVDEGYGLHVHVSRNAFRSTPKNMTYAQAAERGIVPSRYRSSAYANLPYRTKQSPTHQMAWLLFLYRNRDHIDNPRQLARRDCSEWGSFEDTNPGDLKRKAYDSPTADNRYVAVNTNNEKTYELRFFASTLSEVQFWAALEFADASVEYTRNMRARDILRGNALSWAAFTIWVGEHDYPNLSAELARIESAYPAIAATRRAETERERIRQEAQQTRRHAVREHQIAAGERPEWLDCCGYDDCSICYPRRATMSPREF